MAFFVTPSPAFCFCLFCCCSVGHIAFLFLIGDPHGITPLDNLYRLAYVRLPRQCRSLCRWVFGPKFEICWDRFIHYLFYTNNCCAQVFYLFLTVGGYTGFITTGYPHFPTPFLPDQTPFISLMVMAACLVSFVAVSTSDAGTITDENVDELELLYPYDATLFPEGRICETCKIPKIARSKHCRLCDRCVLKFDHHCIWVGNCIGLNNYNLFLIFLLTHTMMTIYGAIGLFLLLKGIIEVEGLWNARFVDRITHVPILASWSIVIQYMTGQYLILCYLWVCCVIFALVLICFTSWHFYQALILKSTTNETFKKKHLRSENEQDAIPNIYYNGDRIVYEVFCPQLWAQDRILKNKES